MASTIRPLHDRIIVRRIEAEQMRGGLYIPDTAKEKLRRVKSRGCNGKVLENGSRQAPDVKLAIASSSASTPEARSLDGEDYLILRETTSSVLSKDRSRPRAPSSTTRRGTESCPVVQPRDSEDQF